MFDLSSFTFLEFLAAAIVWVLSCIWVVYPLLGSSEASENHAYFQYVTGERSFLDRYNEKYKGRFAIIDLLALTVVVQYPLVIVAYTGNLTPIIGIVIFVACSCLWWIGLVALAKHLVIDWRRRFALLSIVLPSLFLVAVPAVVVNLSVLRQAYISENPEHELAMYGIDIVIAVLFYLWFLFMARTTVVWCISPYSRWSPWG